MADAAVSVVIVDDQPTFRRAAAAVVSALPGFEVVREAETEQGSVDSIGSMGDVDLVLMDINLEEGDGLMAARRITRLRPEILVILMSTYENTDLPADARTCGAAAYLHKEHLSPDRLRRLWRDRGDPGWQADGEI